jgi:catechol 2,3-dioxygenase-like lactoylglutathione lyase family enzyme
MTDEGDHSPLARFKDLCLDAVDIEEAARFWSAALGLKVRRSGSNVRLAGPSAAHTVWINQVPEPKTVKNRVHLDVHTGSLAELTDRGARVVPATEELPWTVLTDPDGQEFCAFVRDSRTEEVPDYRLYEVVIDCAASESKSLALWWASVLGGELEADGDDWGLAKMPGVPFEYLVFGAVPEPKTIKNRVHWDVEVADLDLLISAGATLLRPRGDDIKWHVLADPAGNEFCAFVPRRRRQGRA